MWALLSQLSFVWEEQKLSLPRDYSIDAEKKVGYPLATCGVQLGNVNIFFTSLKLICFWLLPWKKGRSKCEVIFWELLNTCRGFEPPKIPIVNGFLQTIWHLSANIITRVTWCYTDITFCVSFFISNFFLLLLQRTDLFYCKNMESSTRLKKHKSINCVRNWTYRVNIELNGDVGTSIICHYSRIYWQKDIRVS